MIRSLFFFLSLAGALGARALPSQSLPAKLDAYMKARESLGQFSGAVLVSRNGKVLLSKGYGYSNIEKRTHNSETTEFRAASITKQFTAMAVLQLREAGKLSLTDSICKWIDKCPAVWQAVTLAHLIHHSSGIPDYEEKLELGSPAYDAFMQQANHVSIILDSARARPLDFAPGSKFHYSNTGYILLAHVIEKASGMKYSTYMQSKIFKPAGLSSTGILDGSTSAGRLATGYQSSSSPAPLERVVAGIPFIESNAVTVAPIDLSGIHGDGGMYATVGDLDRWLSVLENGRFINASLYREYMTPVQGYAFGWIVDSTAGMARHFHTGALPGFISRIERYPDSALTVVVMANADFFRVTRIARDLAAAALGRPFDVPRSHVIVKRDTVAEARLAGVYMLASGDSAKVTVGDRYLELQVPGRFTAGLLPESESLFYAPFFEGTVRFDRDSSGKVTGLVMHYDGIDRRADSSR